MADNIIANSFYSYARLGLQRQSLSIIDMHKRIVICCCACDENSEKVESETSKGMLAVYDTLRLLAFSGRTNEIHAVYAVYFSTHGRKPKKNELQLRVLRHAYDQNCDARTVYRRLSYAKKLFSFIYNFNNTEIL